MNFPQNEVIEIARAENGYAVKKYWEDEDDNGKSIIKSDITLFESEDEVDEENGEKEAVISLLYFIAEEFCGIHYDKYGKENLEINFNLKGSKVEDE